MDPDQSPQSQDAQMCLAPAPDAVTSSSSAPAPQVSVPGPADGGADNPVLASVAASPASGSTSAAPDSGASVGSVINTGLGWLGTAAGYLQGDATGGATSLTKESMAANNVGGVVGGVTGMIGGGVDLYNGMDQLSQGNTATGLYDLGKGGLEELGGAATLLSAPGVANAATNALGLAGDTAGAIGTLGKIGGGIGGVLGILGGGEDINQGFNDLNSKDNTTQTTGGLEVGKGALEVAGGAATTYGALAGGSIGLGADIGAVGAATGATAAAAGGLILGAAAAGVGAGIGMESATKSSGLLHEDGVVGPDGKPINESGADKVADWGTQVSQWIDPSKTNDNGSFHAGGGTGPGLLDGNFSMAGLQSSAATAGGLAATLAGTPVALGMDIAGTGVAGWNWLKSKL
jgi:hypothetical protein